MYQDYRSVLCPATAYIFLTCRVSNNLCQQGVQVWPSQQSVRTSHTIPSFSPAYRVHNGCPQHDEATR
jgi:hypothetical protein